MIVVSWASSGISTISAHFAGALNMYPCIANRLAKPKSLNCWASAPRCVQVATTSLRYRSSEMPRSLRATCRLLPFNPSHVHLKLLIELSP